MARTFLSVDLDTLIAGWRGPLLAALVALIAGMPSLFTIPILDRQEARVVQVTAERIDAGLSPDPQASPYSRQEAGVLVHGLQALSVAALSDVEARDVRPYRLPSLLGAMLAVWAVAWGAAALWGARVGFLAGAMLGATYLLSTLAGVATADALGAGAISLAMAALGQIYATLRQDGMVARPLKLAFWGGLGLAMLTSGLVGPLIVGLTLLTLALWDRDARLLAKLGWGWGLPLLALMVGPWIIAATVASDGDIWARLWMETRLGRVFSGRAEWGWPGSHLLLAPLLLFPATLMLPAAVMTGLTRRAEPAVRFAVAWVAPAWLVFELAPDQNWAQTLPLFGAITWLAAAALTRPLGRISRRVGVVLAVVGGVYVLGATLYALSEFGGEASRAWATPTIGLTLAAAGIGGFLLFHRMPVSAVLASLALGVLAHASLTGVVRTLEPLSVSPRLAHAVSEAGLNPVESRYPGPIAVAGYSQPSVVFLLGAGTRLTDARGAAEAIAEGRPAVVEARLEESFRTALSAHGAAARRMGAVEGLNYVNGDDVALTLYAPEVSPR
jgi:4-amino-4-deoxy-L-arabinose transferase-like glycosyltransferase